MAKKLWHELQLMGTNSILLMENIVYEIRSQLDPKFQRKSHVVKNFAVNFWCQNCKVSTRNSENFCGI